MVLSPTLTTCSTATRTLLLPENNHRLSDCCVYLKMRVTERKGVDLLNGYLFFYEKGDVLWISELSVKEERREYQKEWE